MAASGSQLTRIGASISAIAIKLVITAKAEGTIYAPIQLIVFAAKKRSIEFSSKQRSIEFK